MGAEIRRELGRRERARLRLEGFRQYGTDEAFGRKDPPTGPLNVSLAIDVPVLRELDVPSRLLGQLAPGGADRVDIPIIDLLTTGCWNY